MPVMATASFTTPITDDPWAVIARTAGPFNAAVHVASTSYPYFQLTEPMDIVAIYASLQVVASSAATLTLYKISGTGTAGLLSTGTALTSALTLTATDFTAGQLHDVAEKAVAGTWTSLPAGTIIGGVTGATATTGLVGLSLTFVMRKAGYVTTTSGGKFYPVPSPVNF